MALSDLEEFNKVRPSKVYLIRQSLDFSLNTLYCVGV